MICPQCGTEVPQGKFCENCGAQLPQQEHVETAESLQSTQPPADAVFEAPAATQAPVAVEEASEAAAPAAATPVVEAVPVAAPVAGAPEPPVQTATFAGNANQGAAVPGYQTAPQAPAGTQNAYSGAAQFQSDTRPETVTNTAFVCAIVGLVLALLGIGFLPGIVLCIVALVLNSKNNKSGLSNPHKTSTTVLSIIGLVASVLFLVFTILVGVLAVQAVDYADKNSVSVTRSSSTYSGRAHSCDEIPYFVQ